DEDLAVNNTATFHADCLDDGTFLGYAIPEIKTLIKQHFHAGFEQHLIENILRNMRLEEPAEFQIIIFGTVYPFDLVIAEILIYLMIVEVFRGGVNPGSGIFIVLIHTGIKFTGNSTDHF